jgi:hypothetical protein
VTATIAALKEEYTGADMFETDCQIRGDEPDDAGTHALARLGLETARR